MDERERRIWREADAALDRLLALPAEGRSGALASMGLEVEVEARVRALLDADAGASGPLDRELHHLLPAEDGVADDPWVGRRVGAFRLVERVGRGGMGVVYRAARSDAGFHQEVAVKLLQWALPGTAGAGRFLRERQILARLKHPGIATLLDGGIAPDGTPYLVMELIDGEPIDRYCEREGLPVAGRVELVRQVCRALGYAHGQLIVHRDIKPANVLVEAGGHVRLLDFGIAKLMEEDAEGEDSLTRPGERPLTPEFAAPEQLLGGAVTTATDVYGVGLLLYRLLVGERAFRNDGRRREASDLPPPPSTARAATIGSNPDGVAPGEIDADLDRIVLMALRPEPERRYPGVGELDRDLARWLRKEPVSASPDSLRYRVDRFVARRRGAVVASTVALAVAVGGLTTTLWQAREARRQSEQATAESIRAQAARDFLVQLFEANDPDIAQGRVITARELLDQGAHRIRSTPVPSSALQAELLVLLGGLYRKIGEFDAAEPLLADGAALAGTDGDTGVRVSALHQLGTLHMEVGRHDEALARLEEAERILEGAGLVPSRQHGALLQQLVFTLNQDGRRPEGLARAEAALLQARGRADLPASALFDYLFVYSNALLGSDRPEEAEPLLREAMELDFDTADRPDRQRGIHANLAQILQRRGALEEAIQHGYHALALAEQVHPPLHSRRGQALSNLASILIGAGRSGEAAEMAAEALRVYQAVYPDPRHPRVAAAHNNLGNALVDAGRLSEAEPHLDAARSLARDLFGPRDMRYATATANLGTLVGWLGRHAEGEALLLEALDLRRSVLGEDHSAVGATLGLLAELELSRDQPARALDRADQALDLYRRIGWEVPAGLLFALERRARALDGLGRPLEAGAVFDEALGVGERAGRDGGRAWAYLLGTRAEFLARHGDPGAEAALEWALAVHRETLAADNPARGRLEALARARRP